MASVSGLDRWSLEVVKGRDVGRRFLVPSASGEFLVGNALNGESGIDLAGQEASSARRMAGRQACLIRTHQGLAIRDLTSPGGTFVNRQRLLSGQERVLEPDDLIQLGGVQLKVVLETASPRVSTATTPPGSASAPRSGAPATGASDSRAGTLTVPFRLAGGSTCRTWDDFLVLAAQRWTSLRDEMTSGRLAAHLRLIRRDDLLPRTGDGTSADESLDQWLGTLPVTRSSAPELEVHPEQLLVRPVGGAGGGQIRHMLVINNTGYRLMRCTARVESTAAGSIRIPPEFTRDSFATIERTEIPVDIELPEGWRSAALGSIVIEGNGGKKRIPVQLERPVNAHAIGLLGGDLTPGIVPGVPGMEVIGRLAKMGLSRRILAAVILLLLFRTLLMFVSYIVPGPTGGNTLDPRPGVTAAVLAGIGALLGLRFARRGGETGDALTSAFACTLAGFIASAPAHALVRTVEHFMIFGTSSIFGVLVQWIVFGAGIAVISYLVVPPARSAAMTEPMA